MTHLHKWSLIVQYFHKQELTLLMIPLTISGKCMEYSGNLFHESWESKKQLTSHIQCLIGKWYSNDGNTCIKLYDKRDDFYLLISLSVKIVSVAADDTVREGHAYSFQWSIQMIFYPVLPFGPSVICFGRLFSGIELCTLLQLHPFAFGLFYS